MKTLQAVGRHVLIRPDEKPSEEVSAGGIVIAASEESASDLREIIYGVVVSVGNGGYSQDEFGDDAKFAKPDESLFHKRVGYRMLDVKLVEQDGAILHAIDFEDLLAICHEE